MIIDCVHTPSPFDVQGILAAMSLIKKGRKEKTGSEAQRQKNLGTMPGTYLQGRDEGHCPQNEKFCMVLPPNGMSNLDIYIGQTSAFTKRCIALTCASLPP